jgi:hypothetical protein
MQHWRGFPLFGTPEHLFLLEYGFISVKAKSDVMFYL